MKKTGACLGLESTVGAEAAEAHHEEPHGQVGVEADATRLRERSVAHRQEHYEHQEQPCAVIIPRHGAPEPRHGPLANDCHGGVAGLCCG